MKLGLFDLIGLATTLVFALPLANYAVIQLLAGETAMGVGLLVVAVAMVVLPQYFLDPGRILGGLVRGLLPRRLRGGDDAESTAVNDAESTAVNDAGSTAVNDAGSTAVNDAESDVEDAASTTK